MMNTVKAVLLTAGLLGLTAVGALAQAPGRPEHPVRPQAQHQWVKDGHHQAQPEAHKHGREQHARQRNHRQVRAHRHVTSAQRRGMMCRLHQQHHRR